MPTKDTPHIHISTGTIIRFFLVIFGIAALYIVRDVLAALFLAVIIASALEPAIDWLKERRVPRLVSVILIYLGITLGFFFLTYLIFPLLIEELRSITYTYPVLEREVLRGVRQVGELPFLSFLTIDFESLVGASSAYLEKLGGGILNFASLVFGGAFSLFLIVIFSFYLAIQERGIESFLRLVSPVSQEPYVIGLWERSQRKLGRWLRAQMLLAALVGVLIFFGLTFLGIKHALLFAVLAALFEVIPVAGPILASVPAVMIAFLTSPLLGVAVAALYLGVQQFESHVIVPVVMRKTIGLSPLVVVLALLVGLKLGGIFGVLLAVPVTAILAELVNDWDKKKRALIPE
ncbi:MAG: AI-2E family transporter [Candidatus Sungiibacteriota bacterium]|uniref:AI-2E family transporter n=1 Tax=Candidatus Sungiibacteriota bacterium TaxID=2750080 RepID=A0A7T5UQC9_9BACT|nr:MAG: AI-2E family transporter [Candidatus Sungbacteria bacterium]